VKSALWFKYIPLRSTKEKYTNWGHVDESILGVTYNFILKSIPHLTNEYTHEYKKQ
jgi:hypothetical protein